MLPWYKLIVSCMVCGNIALTLCDARPTLARYMISKIVKSSMNLALSSSGTLSALLLDCDRYSRIPHELPCKPDPGRGLSDDSFPLQATLMDLLSKKEARIGMRDALTPFLMEVFTPRVRSCIGNAFFQSINVASTATHSPFEQLSVMERILSII